MSIITAPVSYGEILDKITILEIKTVNIADPKKQKNVKHELDVLQKIWTKHIDNSNEIKKLKHKLKEINQSLWNIEDNIRIKESKKQFDDEFIQIARSVYFENDKRAAIKKQLNLLLGSELVEEKSYKNYQ
ncbi:FIG01218102: hypothetical protein [hydrothermal vent metagenome]|uniref:Uncharacterized protein n=1 Tax=hydrothermal vent metagenome TaxID=652676 RepID=A0A3B0VLB5_9ZZZZ